ncbi:MAG: hypothetical protein ACUVSU_16105 [Aggregatilineaceae bacterium]
MSKERASRRHELSLPEVARLAQDTLLRDGTHLPTVIAEGSEQTAIAQIAYLAGTHEERAQQLFIAGFTLAQSRLVGRLRQVFFIAEGWMSEAEEGKLPEYPPSQDPRRKEVLFVSSLQVMDRRTELMLFEMLRDDEDQLREVRQYQPPTSDTEVTSPLLAAFIAGFYAGSEG